MRIGLDARKLADGGIGTYIRHLLAALPAVCRDDRLVAFVHARDRDRVELGSGSVETVPVRTGNYSLAEHWALPRAARRAGVELYHAPHYTLPLGWRGPAVVTIHDLIHVRLGRHFRAGAALYARAVAGAAARHARLILANSSWTKSEVMALLGAPAERVTVTPLGVSAALARRPRSEVESFARERGLPSGYLLYVGARKPHKNLGLLFQALATWDPRARPPLVLSGSRWGAGDPLARAARRAGVAESVRFSGPLRGEEDLARLYSGALLYLQPSLCEGFGLPPLEAMACGVPVLSSSGGALPETLGDAAELLPPRDAEAWAARISHLLGDQGRRAELERRGLERARGFTWERTAELTRAAYREALG